MVLVQLSHPNAKSSCSHNTDTMVLPKFVNKYLPQNLCCPSEIIHVVVLFYILFPFNGFLQNGTLFMLHASDSAKSKFKYQTDHLILLLCRVALLKQ